MARRVDGARRLLTVAGRTLSRVQPVGGRIRLGRGSRPYAWSVDGWPPRSRRYRALGQILEYIMDERRQRILLHALPYASERQRVVGEGDQRKDLLPRDRHAGFERSFDL